MTEPTKPGVERGFASETPGRQFKTKCEPAKRAKASHRCCRAFHGLMPLSLNDPGAALAEPRSTPGYMLTPASQA